MCVYTRIYNTFTYAISHKHITSFFNFAILFIYNSNSTARLKHKEVDQSVPCLIAQTMLNQLFFSPVFVGNV